MDFATLLPTEGYPFHHDNYSTSSSDAGGGWYGQPIISDRDGHYDPSASIPLATARCYLADVAMALDKRSYKRFIVLLEKINSYP